MLGGSHVGTTHTKSTHGLLNHFPNQPLPPKKAPSKYRHKVSLVRGQSEGDYLLLPGGYQSCDASHGVGIQPEAYF